LGLKVLKKNRLWSGKTRTGEKRPGVQKETANVLKKEGNVLAWTL